MPPRARVKVKQKSVTRAQAVEEFSRKKAKQRRAHVKRRVLLVGGGMALVYALVGGWWMVHTGQLQTAVAHANMRLWQQTAALGFRIDQVTLRGRTHADRTEIMQALQLSQGGPILAVSLMDMRARLEAIAEVKSVRITRQLPNQLDIALVERTPAAWWQHQGVQQLIDADGVVLARSKYKAAMTLPVVVGAQAPKHVGELLALLESAPSLKPDVMAAVRVGNRRWNIQLSRDMVVMLPEENPDQAWKRFAQLAAKEGLLGKAIRSVDMRIEDRVFIMPIEQQQNPITLTTARET
jgi:cell division protein FtsQ